MIERFSKSYPYLAIAQHYNVSYAEVLFYADLVADYEPEKDERIAANEWQTEVIRLVLVLAQ